LVRAYTDTVAQALLNADKIVLQPQVRLACGVPYALEGLLRRELAAHDAQDVVAAHGDTVEFAFALPQDRAAALRARLDDVGQGAVRWQLTA
jgi:putative IMPACT (imprinted ancient) family translation regulator